MMTPNIDHRIAETYHLLDWHQISIPIWIATLEYEKKSSAGMS